MKLTDITTAPKLVKITLDDKEIIKEFGEEITFYTPDRQPLNVYLELSESMGKDGAKSIEILKTLILDENGDKVIKDDKVPPVKVMVKAMAKVMELLGN